MSLKEIKNCNESMPIFATQTGKLCRIETVPDDVFSQKILGDGVAIVPSERIACSPITGTISFIADTAHAFYITTSEGVEVLVHVGIDTVELKGEGFTLLRKVGDFVQAGDPVMDFDVGRIKALGFYSHTMTIFCDVGAYKLLSENETLVTAGQTVVARLT